MPVKYSHLNIYDYLDYREYLKILTHHLKKEQDFNVRSFAQKAGIKSPGFLKMVIDGQRDIIQKTAEGFCKALQIKGREKKYFLQLVHYNQETNPTQKQELLGEIFKARPRSLAYRLENKHNRYFSQPYYVCVREMVALKDFKEDPKWISSRSFPKIRPSQAKEAIKTLLELGLLKRDEKGRLVQSEGFLQTDDDIKASIETYHYHEAILDKTRQALGLLPQKERSYYAMTLPIPVSFYPDIIREFHEFRDRLMQKLEEKAKTESLDEIYQINFQLFPLTKRRDL